MSLSGFQEAYESAISGKKVTNSVPEAIFEKEEVETPKESFYYFKQIGSKILSLFNIKQLSTQQKIIVSKINEYLKDDDVIGAMILRKSHEQLDSYTEKDFNKTFINQIVKEKNINDCGAVFLETILAKNLEIDYKFLATFCLTEVGHNYLLKAIHKYDYVIEQRMSDFTDFPVLYKIIKEEKESFESKEHEKIFLQVAPKLQVYINKALKDPEFTYELYLKWENALNTCASQAPKKYLEGNDQYIKQKSRDYLILERTSKCFLEFQILSIQPPTLEYVQNLNEKINKLIKKISAYVSKDFLEPFKSASYKDNFQSEPFKSYLKYQKIMEQEVIADHYAKMENKNNNDVNQNTIPKKENNYVRENSEEIKKKVVIPYHAKLIMNEIIELNNLIIPNLNMLSDNQRHDIQSLTEKRIPEILNKYMDIDVKYREGLKNVEGKSADELLVQSLGSVKQIFTNMVEYINMSKLSSLSVTQRYLKSVTQSYTDTEMETQSIVEIKPKLKI
jgi:hypothetical protein